jgi:UDP-N-acetylglucosamine--N-acetylmuramyl-(pentapeptide) pyrophosphoryl-undecaprenol N-acetylglucosamine transferase
MNKSVFFTGGGIAGNVTPNIALIEHLISKRWEVTYVGSDDGIDRRLTKNLNITYCAIATGKFRRQLEWELLLDPLLVVLGLFQSIFFCLTNRPDIVFSKGGLVAVPVVIAAWICRIPVISHESDIKPRLVNRLCFLLSEYVCISFPRTARSLPRKMMGERTKFTGSPIRRSVLRGDAEKGRLLLGFTGKKPVLLVLGAGLGSEIVNDCMRQCRFQLLRYFQIIHVVGEGNLNAARDEDDSYVQREYLHEEFGHILAAADLVISRAGGNSIYEFLVMRKCHLLIPLSKRMNGRTQTVNAEAFERAGMSIVLPEVELTPETLIESLSKLRRQRKARMSALRRFKARNSVTLISNLIGHTIKQVEARKRAAAEA